MQYRLVNAVAALIVFAALVAGDALAQAPAPATGPASPDNFNDVARVQSLGTFVSFMNLAAGTARLVAVVSPSASTCPVVIASIAAVLRANPSKRLRAYVVLSHLSPDDSDARSITVARSFRDRRLVYLIDPNAVVAAAFAPICKSAPDPATSVCFLYDTGARLALEPPAPSLWMSANPKIKGPRLDAAVLGQRANDMVRRVEQMAGETNGTKN